jgi:CMP-N-acetylneuraminic acid synthetase
MAYIAGKPLIAFTIAEALKTSLLTDLVVSTDDVEIATLARSLGAQVPFTRPAELATDDAESAPVLKHALDQMEARHGIYDAVMMLQPTSPLRRSLHIEKAIRMMSSCDCDSVVSVVSVEGNHPFRMKRLIGDWIVNYIDQGHEDMRPRQELPPVYIRNGAIYLSRREIIAELGCTVGGKCLGLVMTSEESINIDNHLDLKLAEFLLEKRSAK